MIPVLSRGYARRRAVVAGGLSPPAGYALWLKADAGVLDGTGNPAADGVAVATWQDQSGNALHMTQATSGQRPTFKTAIINGQPVIRFAAASSQMLFNTSADWSQPVTVFAVVNLTGASRNQDEVWGGGAVSFYVASQAGGTGGDLYAGASNSDGTFYAPRGPDVMSWVLNGASSAWYANGTLRKSGNSGSGAIADLKIGNSIFGSYFNGDIAEFLLYPSALNTTDRQTTEAYLADEYAL